MLFSYKSQLTKERDELLNTLDLKYMHYINTILQQKFVISQSIQRQYDQQLSFIENLLLTKHNTTKTFKSSNINLTPTQQAATQTQIKQINTSNNNQQTNRSATQIKTQPVNTKQYNDSSSNKDLHCLYCSNSFISYAQLRTHISCTHKDRSYICKHCPYACKNSNLIKKHNKQHQKQHRGYSCDSCNKLFNSNTSFPQPWTLTLHKRRVHKIKTHTKYNHSNNKIKMKTKKDNNIKSPSNPRNIPLLISLNSPPIENPFIAHMSQEEVFKLCINDKIDHRDFVGCFREAIIVGKNKNKLKIHYIGWENSYDKWIDINNKFEIYKISKYKSISKRIKHRFYSLIKGDYIDINPLNYPGWKIGQVIDLDTNSG
eukprot:502800_1